MHMADALLSPAVAVTMYAASAAAGVSLVQLRREELAAPETAKKKLPTMAVMSALVFAGQMINYTIPGTGSSGHLCGGMLLSAMLGPWAGFLSMIVILAIQALFFADGGLLALGANVWNMAFYGCFVGYFLIYRPLMRGNLSAGKARLRLTLASVLGCVATLQLGAFSVVLETTLSGITALPLGAFAVLMQPIHLAIGLVEGLITAAGCCSSIRRGLSCCRTRQAPARKTAARVRRHWRFWRLPRSSSAAGCRCWQAPARTDWNGRCSAMRRPGIRPTWALTKNNTARRALPRKRRPLCRKKRPSCRITALRTATAQQAHLYPASSAA